jgi:hypothetical protein
VTRKHSRLTVIIVDGNDISADCTDSNCEQSFGTEDNTTYGKTVQVFDPTLGTGACGFSGKYANGATGPRAILKPLAATGAAVNIKYRPEGTGSGLPQDSFTAVITKYTETAPVAGYRTWACETQPSDVWDSTNQA